ncbi:MAG: [FeFe] hydrogenase, group A, partial [Candidatus Omnitrophica bacterium]|nr:[FeFe] hydrogenase, group A [Candidatus Omnitrophota bacterium]
MDEKKVNLTIDGLKVSVPAEMTIMQGAETIGIRLPRLCYHSRLSEAGACRVCVVEVEGMKNFVPSCCTKVAEGMVIRTNTTELLQARRDIIELLLDNHPEDCQTCERNGDCELQTLAQQFGIRERLYQGEKKHFLADQSSLAIVRDPNKCILCGKCVRVCSEIQAVNALSFSHRGFRTNVGPAFDLPARDSVCINCGQCTLVCPTGALTERDDTQKVWQALNDPDKIVMVQIAPAVRVTIGEPFGYPAGTDMTNQTVTALRRLGFDRVFDTQFSADLTIMEEAHELISRLNHGGKLPMFTSCSPGWIKFCEHFHPDFLENLSTCKSPQQMMGALIKTYYAQKQGLDPAAIYSVSIMPCTAKKFEAARPEMKASCFPDVDAVLTTRELARMIKQAGLKFSDLKPEEFDDPLGESTGAATIFGVTGGVLEAALRTA